MNFKEYVKEHQLFQVKSLGDGIHVIQDIVGVEMYLIEGNEKAILLDTGIGIGNVKKVVENITDKPIEVYLTHGHVDHAGGIYHFHEAWVSEEDIELLHKHTTPEFRFDFASTYLPEIKEIDDITEAMAYHDNLRLYTISPGDVIELGKRQIQVVNLKGHTHGSIGYFDEKTKTLFAGDGCNNSTFLFLEESTSVTAYHSMLLSLKKEWMPKVKRFIICHEYIEVPLSVVDDLIECCEMVLESKGSGTEFIIPYVPFQNGRSYWAVKGEEHREMADGKIGNMIYDYKKIY